jgi:hypothetical protein
LKSFKKGQSEIGCAIDGQTTLAAAIASQFKNAISLDLQLAGDGVKTKGFWQACNDV